MEGNERISASYDGSLPSSASHTHDQQARSPYLIYDNAYQAEPQSAGSNGRTSLSGPTREEIDAKLQSTESRIDAKLAAFQGQFDRVSDKLDGISSAIKDQHTEANANRTAIITTVMAVGFALAGLLVAVVTYGDAIFSRGMSVRDMVHSAVEELATKQSKTQ